MYDDLYFDNDDAEETTEDEFLINGITPLQMFDELRQIITTCGIKLKKRKTKFAALCKMLDVGEEYVKQLKLAKEETTEITQNDIKRFINSGDTEMTPGSLTTLDISTNSTNNKHDLVKKAIEAELTTMLNHDLYLYKITSVVAYGLWKEICLHDKFKDLCEDKKIIFVSKGSVVQRLSLIDSYGTKYADLIDSNFKLGGDNDCSILIDPTLENFHSLHSDLMIFIRSKMNLYVDDLNMDSIVTERAQTINELIVNDMVLHTKSTKRESFTIKREDKNNLLQTGRRKHGVFVSCNDTLEFNDTVGRKMHFALVRYKKAFEVSVYRNSRAKKRVGAELLDISIPYNDDANLCEHFHHYASGQYIKKINLNNF